jgi:hypothetical protein
MADIFLSYAREDEPRARLLAAALESYGWSVWWDRRIPPGQVFTTYIQRQLDAARCIVVLWSKASVTSQFVNEEAREGVPDRLVPALIEPVKLPLGFRDFQTANLSDWHTGGTYDEFDRLVDAISAIVPPSPAAPTAQPPAVSPPAQAFVVCHRHPCSCLRLSGAAGQKQTARMLAATPARTNLSARCAIASLRACVGPLSIPFVASSRWRSFLASSPLRLSSGLG